MIPRIQRHSLAPTASSYKKDYPLVENDVLHPLFDLSGLILAFTGIGSRCCPFRQGIQTRQGSFRKLRRANASLLGKQDKKAWWLLVRSDK